MDIAQAIREIEAQVGRISPVQKVLLGTDGSVTQLLESVTGKQVVIKTLVQNVVPADRETANNLSITEGDPVNYRIVEIRAGDTGDVLIYAISHTPLSRLSPEFRDDLMRADIPIGRIIQQHHIEARRQILNARVLPATDETGRIFSIARNEPVLSRQYRIIHSGKPLIFIEEQFPYNRFLDNRRVIISTPSRIHVTLIDMHGGSGRVDGGIGITLDEPGILLEAELSPVLQVRGGDEATRERIGQVAAGVLQSLGAGGSVAITVRSSYPCPCGTRQRIPALSCRGPGGKRAARPPSAGQGAGPARGPGRDLRDRHGRIRVWRVHHRWRSQVRERGGEDRFPAIIRIAWCQSSPGDLTPRVPGGLAHPGRDSRPAAGCKRGSGDRYLPEPLPGPARRGAGTLPRSPDADAARELPAVTSNCSVHR